MPNAAAPAAALALVLLAAGPACAQAAKSVDVTFGLGGATDYEFRGVSQTRNRPDAFASVDAELGGLSYAGVWASNVDFGNGTGAEVDLYGGVRPKLGPVTVDLGLIRYVYAGQSSGPHQDYTELKLAPSMALGPATFGAAWYHSEDFFGEKGPANYVEANASLPIGASPFSLSGAVGRQQVKGPADYTTWNLGVSYAFRTHLGFDLRYWDTDSHGLGSTYGSKLVLGLKATFP
jgi:uncharacterized protein (TIGR02001 family)